MDPRQIDPATLAKAMGYKLVNEEEERRKIRARFRNGVRIQIPMEASLMAEVASLLRSLATDIEVGRKLERLSDYELLGKVNFRVGQINHRLRHLVSMHTTEQE